MQQNIVFSVLSINFLATTWQRSILLFEQSSVHFFLHKSVISCVLVYMLGCDQEFVLHKFSLVFIKLLYAHSRNQAKGSIRLNQSTLLCPGLQMKLQLIWIYQREMKFSEGSEKPLGGSSSALLPGCSKNLGHL